MKHLVALVLAVAVSGCSLFNFPQPPTVAPGSESVNTVSSAMANVVELQDADGRTFCSGVITQGLVLTAAHCADGDDTIYVSYGDLVFPVDVMRVDEEQDLAALRPRTFNLGAGIPVSADDPQYGEPVIVIGHPLGTFTYSMTKGIVSHPRRVSVLGNDSGLVWFQHDAATIGGNSGGPVLNVYGEILGIVSFGIITLITCPATDCSGAYQNTAINGAIHTESIRAFLEAK